MMFQRIDIRLTGPICDCTELDLSWGLFPTGGGYGLELSCKKCKTKLTIPHDKFVARMVTESVELKNPNPDYQPQKAPAPKNRCKQRSGRRHKA